ncbi:MAG TPA: DUF6519 domain-containing protein [Pyrinomonadaceae bacterium]|nr:DUF6519 domain-containing protein [Pyrinomonadaceae bacterium]
MKGDFSRDTFDAKKRYGGVLMQQGRVQLDADWNEQLAINLHRTQTEAIDVIGHSGAPRGTDGFRVEPLGRVDLALSPGRMYVGGLLCELSEPAPVPAQLTRWRNRVQVEYLDAGEGPFAPGHWVLVSAGRRPYKQLRRVREVVVADARTLMLTLTEDLTGFNTNESLFVRRVVTYTTQPDYPSPPVTFTSRGPASPPELSPPLASPPATSPPIVADPLKQLDLSQGRYLVYLHAWQRHVTALDDPRIRESALGGPDTAARLKNVWQAGLLRVDAGVADCSTDFPAWRALTEQPSGAMSARIQPVKDDQDPCTLPPSAGYRRLENQLYRVEVHRGGPRQQATFKWSRENGSIETKIESIEQEIVTVAGLGRDEVQGFAGGQWVEVVDDESELSPPFGSQRPLLRITGQPDHERGEITLNESVAHLSGRAGLKLRRWDQAGAGLAEGVAMTGGGAADAAGWVVLEGGIQVHFSEGTYRAGDYWLIPARTATGDIEWPPFGPSSGQPVARPPHGQSHHFCRLALLTVAANGEIAVADCREVFPPLTDITARDVSFDNANCLPAMTRAKTVQDAIEVLCNARQGGGCTHVAVPGPGWEAVFDYVGAEQDAQICFLAGNYPLTGTVNVRGKGHIKLSGTGPGTRIVAPNAEAALNFENCRGVTVRDLYAETGSTREPTKRPLNLTRMVNGTLTFINCDAVVVEHVTLKCGSGWYRSSACVTVRGSEKDRVSARVLHCDLSVGHRQTGVLLVDVARSHVEDNVVRVYEKPERLRFPKAVLIPRLRAEIRAALISRLVVTARPNVRPSGRTNVNVTKTLGQHTLHFSAPTELRKDWQRALDEIPPPETRTSARPRVLQAHVRRLADRALLEEQFRVRFPAFGAIYERLRSQDKAVAAQGITVGGRFAEEVRILNNTVEDVLQGIHVGLSRAVSVDPSDLPPREPPNVETGPVIRPPTTDTAPTSGSITTRDAASELLARRILPPTRLPLRDVFDIAGEVTIKGNSVRVLLPFDTRRGDRHGIFVGNCRRLRIEDNDVSIRRTDDAAGLDIDGIRVWGVMGDYLTVSRNFIRRGDDLMANRFTFGVHIQRHRHPRMHVTTKPGWFAVENVVSCVNEPPVIAPSGTIVRENIRIENTGIVIKPPTKLPGPLVP